MSFAIPESVAHARQLQQELRSRVRVEDDLSELRLIAGIDVGYDLTTNRAHASIVTLNYDTLNPHEQVQAYAPVTFPYVPGLLSFREIPAILEALAKLKSSPDLLMVDGQGIAHPRRMGIASHLGVWLDKPSVGVAKSRLFGTYTEPGTAKGDLSPLVNGSERIGTVLRSKDNVNPLFISPGHRVSVETSLAITLHCLTRYRLPEPTRLADKYSKCRPSAQASLFTVEPDAC